MLKRIMIVFGLTVTVAAVSFFTLSRRTVFRMLVAQAASGPITPFTARTTMTQFDKDGLVTATEVMINAVRSDGSQVMLRESINNRSVGAKSLVDVPSRKRISVDPLTRSITTYSLAADDIAALRPQPSACNGGERNNIQGRDVFQKATDEVFGEKNQHRESWLAPELGCFPLRSKVTLSVNGMLKLTKTEEVFLLVVGEPDRSLFAVPADYTERSPSEVFRERARIKGTTCRECDSAGQKLDEAYRSHQ